MISLGTRCFTLSIDSLPQGSDEFLIYGFTTSSALDYASSIFNHSLYSAWSSFTKRGATFSRVGYVTFSPFHFDRSCVQFITTHVLFYSGCSLPPHCGPPISLKVSATWYGSETFFCSSLYSCPDNTFCRHDQLEHTYYSFELPTYWMNPVHNGDESISVFMEDITDYSSKYFLVDHLKTKTAYIYSKECVMRSHRANLDRSLVPDLLHVNFSSGAQSQCVEALTEPFHKILCVPISNHTHDSFTVRANKALLKSLVFYLVVNLNSGYPYIYTKVNFSVPPSPRMYLNETSCMTRAWYEYSIPAFSRCDPTVYPFDIECYHIESHYSNPLALAFNFFLNKIKDALFWILSQIESELATIITWILSIFKKVFLFLLDLILDIPMVFQFLCTYAFVWIMYKSHIIAITVAGTLWIFFSNY